jgi:Uma2 family endonuclease
MPTATRQTNVGSNIFPHPLSGARLFTAADLAAMPEHLPSGDVSYQLHHGRLVVMVPPGAVHGNLQSRIVTELTLQGERKGHGKTYSEVGIVLARKPDHVLGADAAFVSKRSLPVRESPEDYLETIPELVVEIRSKNDTISEIKAKIRDYLRAGTRLVWVVDPSTETAHAHRARSPVKTYRKTDALTCPQIIPGFRLAISELFRP